MRSMSSPRSSRRMALVLRRAEKRPRSWLSAATSAGFTDTSCHREPGSQTGVHGNRGPGDTVQEPTLGSETITFVQQTSNQACVECVGLGLLASPVVGAHAGLRSEARRVGSRPARAKRRRSGSTSLQSVPTRLEFGSAPGRSRSTNRPARGSRCPWRQSAEPVHVPTNRPPCADAESRPPCESAGRHRSRRRACRPAPCRPCSQSRLIRWTSLPCVLLLRLWTPVSGRFRQDLTAHL
jgi:hypothetical protein